MYIYLVNHGNKSFLRNSLNVYTHAVIRVDPSDKAIAVSFCGSLQLAEERKVSAAKCGNRNCGPSDRFVIVPVSGIEKPLELIDVRDAIRAKYPGLDIQKRRGGFFQLVALTDDLAAKLAKIPAGCIINVSKVPRLTLDQWLAYADELMASVAKLPE
jgi:hypothetical protein